MSGPAILRASSFGARELSERDYNFEIQINWVDQTNTELLFEQLQEFSQLHPQKGIGNQKAFATSQPSLEFLVRESQQSQPTESGLKSVKRNSVN